MQPLSRSLRIRFPNFRLILLVCHPILSLQPLPVSATKSIASTASALSSPPVAGRPSVTKASRSENLTIFGYQCVSSKAIHSSASLIAKIFLRKIIISERKMPVFANLQLHTLAVFRLQFLPSVRFSRQVLSKVRFAKTHDSAFCGLFTFSFLLLSWLEYWPPCCS